MSYTIIPNTYSKNMGPGGRFSSNVQAYPSRTVRPATFRVNTQHPLAQGLVFAGLGRNTENGCFEDSAGKHIAITNSAPTWSLDSEINRYALTFDGIDDNVRIQAKLHKPATVEPAPQFTFSCWFKTDDNTAYQQLFHFLRTTFWERSLGIAIDGATAGDPYVARYYGGATYQVTGGTFASDVWTHFAATFKVINNYFLFTLYANGDLVVSAEPNSQWSGLEVLLDGAMIGASMQNGAVINPFSGQMADEMLWHRAISSDEIARLADPTNVMLDDMIVEDAPRVRAARSVRVNRTPARQTSQRPDSFELDYNHPLAQGLVFAGLGNNAGQDTCFDSSHKRNNAAINNAGASRWGFDADLNKHYLDFDGTSDVISWPVIGNISGVDYSFDLGLDVTIAVWIKPDATAADDYLWGMIGTTGTQRFLKFDGSGHIGFYDGSSYHYTTAALNDGAWHHIVSADRDDGSYGERSIYVDGVIDIAFTTRSSNGSYGTHCRLADFGENPDYGAYDGKAADLSVWNRTLSASEIRQLADPENVMLSGLIREPSRKQSRIIVPEIGYMSNPVERERPADFTVDYSHPLAKGLVGAWLGGSSGSEFTDYSATKNHGDIQNSALISKRANGRPWLFFDGATTNDDRVMAGVVDVADKSMTACGWLQLSDVTGYNAIIDSLNADGSYTGFHFGLGYPNAGKLSYYNTRSSWASSNTSLTADTYHHCAVVVTDGLGIQFYLDGVEDGFIADATCTSPVATYAYTRIGRKYNNHSIKGYLADPMVFARALTPAEIRQLADPYNVMLSGMIRPVHARRRVFPGVDLEPVEPKANITILSNTKRLTQRPDQFTLDYSHPLAKGLVFAGLGENTGSSRYIDSSSNKNHGSLYNMTPSVAWKRGSRFMNPMLLFDKTDDYVQCPAPILGSDYTVTIQYDWSPASDSYDTLLGTGTASELSRNSIFIRRTGTSGYIYFTSSSYVSATWFFANLDVIFGSRTISIAKTATGATLFLDGNFKSTQALATDLSWQTLLLGRPELNAGSARHYGGSIGDVMIHDRILSSAEIAQLADPSNVMLSGLIQPILPSHSASRATNKRYWVGRDPNWNQAANWAYGPAQEGGAGVPTSDDDVRLE